MIRRALRSDIDQLIRIRGAVQEGAGLGAVLLAKACEDLKADGHVTLRLHTDPGTKAARLYQRLGWREDGLSADGELQFVLRP